MSMVVSLACSMHAQTGEGNSVHHMGNQINSCYGCNFVSVFYTEKYFEVMYL